MQLFIGSQRDGSPVQVRVPGNQHLLYVIHFRTLTPLLSGFHLVVIAAAQAVPQPLNPDVRVAAGGGEVCLTSLRLLATCLGMHAS